MSKLDPSFGMDVVLRGDDDGHANRVVGSPKGSVGNSLKTWQRPRHAIANMGC
jgi:hypothetical protein